MFRLDLGSAPAKYCDGIGRRHFLTAGVTGMAGISLAQVLQARELSAELGKPKKKTSVILLWLDGGPGHLDMYDMKPEAPPEVRGIWNPISTNVPGFDITELFPLQAKCADKFSIVRSLHHDNGDHFSGAHWMLTSRLSGVSGASNTVKNPGLGAIASKLAGSRKPGVPPYVAIPYAMSVGLRQGYFGGSYLGSQFDAFETEGDPNSDGFKVNNLNIASGLNIDRLQDRRSLLAHFDNVRRDVDRSGKFNAMNRFEQQSYEMVTGKAAQDAFDLSKESPETRDRYGRTSWGQSTLLARRLVEAGVTFATVHFGGWDHHWDLKKGYENYLPQIDKLVSALFTDLSERGMYDDVLVVLCGEFSRTPRMNNGGNGGAPMSMGTPGRDHWGNSMFCLLGGGGVKGGRIVGSTDRKGEAPKDNPLRPGDIHHTIYHCLGIDPSVHFLDYSGRPTIAVDHGAVIQELL